MNRYLDDAGQWVYYCNTCGDELDDDQCCGVAS